MNQENELVLIRLSSLGDVAMLVPVLISFHNSFPEKKIKLISRQRFEPIFTNLEFVNFVGIDKDYKSLDFISLIRFYLDFKPKNKFIFLDGHDVIRTKVLAFLFRLNGNKSYKINKGRTEKKALIRLENKELVQLKTSHERYREVFSKAGYDFKLTNNSFLPKFESENKSKKLIGIAPFAKHSSKQLDLNKWQEIISNLNTYSSNLKFFIFGAGETEKKTAIKSFNNIANLEFIISGRSFEEELKLISQLDIMLSMDSGNGHLAANYGIPVLTIWGSTHPCLGFAPYVQPIENSFLPNRINYPFLPVSVFGKNVPIQYERAIDSIDINSVINRIKDILNF